MNKELLLIAQVNIVVQSPVCTTVKINGKISKEKAQ